MVPQNPHQPTTLYRLHTKIPIYLLVLLNNAISFVPKQNKLWSLPLKTEQQPLYPNPKTQNLEPKKSQTQGWDVNADQPF